jgi:hypothetical protein
VFFFCFVFFFLIYYIIFFIPFLFWGRRRPPPTERQSVRKQHTHTPDKLKDSTGVEVSHITTELLRCVAEHIFRRRDACLQTEGRHVEILPQDTAGFMRVLCPANRPAVSRWAVHRCTAKRQLQSRKPVSILKGHPLLWASDSVIKQTAN